MKRNMVPLMGIAVVVAIISTGVFYGLFAGKLRSTPAETPGRPLVVAAHNLERGAVLKTDDVRISQIKSELSGSYSSTDQVVGATLLASLKANEPLLAERVVTRDPAASSGGVPAGSRALSVRVSESDGVVALLRPGTRVDLQAYQERGNAVELRTILQNVEVLSVSAQPQPGGGNRGTVSIVTVLTRAEDADPVALADSGARIRLALRNPLDDEVESRRVMDLNAVFQSKGQAASHSAGEPRQPAAARPENKAAVQFQLQVLRATAPGANELESKLAGSVSGEALRVARFSADVDASALLRSLEQKQEVEIIGSKSLTASAGRSARFRAGNAACRLGVQISADPHSGQLVVRPDLDLRVGDAVETRQYEDRLPAGSSFLVTGILNATRDRKSLERLFPGHSWGERRLLILVTSHPSASQMSAETTGGRGR